MSDRIRWIQYKGKDILFCDHSGLREEAYANSIAEQEKAILDAKKERILVLLDVSGSYMGKGSTERAKECEEKIKAAGIEQEMAMVGFSGLQRFLGQVLKPDIRFTKSLTDAKEWLVSR